jgi:hypothetical protein
VWLWLCSLPCCRAVWQAAQTVVKKALLAYKKMLDSATGVYFVPADSRQADELVLAS